MEKVHKRNKTDVSKIISAYFSPEETLYSNDPDEASRRLVTRIHNHFHCTNTKLVKLMQDAGYPEHLIKL